MNTINLEKMNTFGAGGTILPVVPFDVAKKAPSLAMLMRYLPNYEFFAEFFGEDLMIKALHTGEFGFSTFAQTETVSEDTARYFAKNGYILANDHKVKYTRVIQAGMWSRKVDEWGYRFWVPNRYSQHTPYVKELFFLKYPWFKLFKEKLFIYDVRGYKDYIFLEMDDKKKGSFYIWVEHLKNLDVQKIIQAHMDYQKSYYKFPSGWGAGITKEKVMEWRSEHCSAAWDPVTLKFLEYVELTRLHENEPDWMKEVN